MLQANENSSLYQLHEIQNAGLRPINMMAEMGKAFYRNPLLPFNYTDVARKAAAASELIERITHEYGKPEFGITHTEINGKRVEVREEIVARKPFCNLIHFVKDTKEKGPKLMIVAPMSGHHATLLRGTVEAMLPFCDVYITDWIDARLVNLSEGKFDFQDYISYTIEFINILGKNLHIMAVCQPSVPVFAATAIMNETKNSLVPASMTLIGGPIDTREAPTKVNMSAKEHSISWYESHFITRVTMNYPGFMRRVYPGFVQLMSFISLNLERHVDSHLQFFNHLVQGDGESAHSHKKFYDEYLSVADLPAEFYLQSVEEVFQKHSLPKGEMVYNGKLVDPKSITRTSMLCLEGELDDISGVGQTKAAMKLTKNLPASMKKYHLEQNVGHYGIFNGRKFKSNVVPIITDFIKEHGN
ncbi:MAG: polyhydroxyalkanoate depolymerase [Pseudomonadota bacterium]